VKRTLQSSRIFREEARTRIIELAKKEFISKGIRQVKMDDFAHALSMSKRTLYQIFADKESLLLACIQERHSYFKALAEKKQQETDNVLEIIVHDSYVRMQWLREVSPLFFVEIGRYPRVMEYMTGERNRYVDHAVGFLQGGVEQGVFRKDVDFRLVMSLLLVQMNRAIAEHFYEVFSPAEVFRHQVVFFFRGCTTAKGMAQMDALIEEMDRQLFPELSPSKP
jgi:AcrR family transcriptional regulator